MNATKGIKLHGERVVEALLKEFAQLDNMNTFKPIKADSISKQERRKSLRLINLIKEKRDGTLKGRTCADGRSQWSYISKEDAASPAVLNTMSAKQNLNTKSNTESNVVGASDYLPKNISATMFLQAQGHVLDKNFFQDNMLAMKLERNGLRSCGQKSYGPDTKWWHWPTSLPYGRYAGRLFYLTSARCDFSMLSKRNHGMGTNFNFIYKVIGFSRI